MDLNTLKTDKTKDLEGVWIDVTTTCKLKVARLGNRKYERAMTTALAQVRLQSDKEEALNRIDIELMADYILLDWEGVELDGEALEYSRENAIKALEIQLFYNLVRSHASDFERFKIDEEQEDLEK